MRTGTIAFDEEGIEFEVRLSPVPVSEYFDVREKRDAARFSDRASFRALCDALASVVVSWNRDTDPSGEALMGEDFNVVIALTGHWVREVTQLPLPLLRSSSDGEPSGELPGSESP